MSNSLSLYQMKLAHLNKAQIKYLIITPSITGLLSSFASVILIVSIFQSNQKVATIYRRLIFSLSVFDIIQSIPQVLSSLPMPADSIWGAIGNDTTCDLQGFFIVIGANGAILYSLSLAVYFLLVIKFGIPEAKIKKLVEPVLHAVPIMYSLTVAGYIYAANNYGPSGTLCWIASGPVNREGDPEVVKSLSGGKSDILKWLGGGFPAGLAFVGNCTILAVIWWSYHSQVERNPTFFAQSYAHQSHSNSQLQRDEEEQTEEPVGKCCPICPMKQCPITNIINSHSSNHRASVLADYLSSPSRASVRRLEEILNRAFAYIIAFLLTYTFTYIFALITLYGSAPLPFTTILLARIFYPLQGFFNVLVYTYPHVISYRRNHTECNWFKAFWKVIRTGGDSDQSRIGTSNRRSIRQRQRVLEQSEYRQRSNFEDIVTSGP